MPKEKPFRNKEIKNLDDIVIIPKEDTSPEKSEQKPEKKTFSIDFVRDKVKSLLESQEAIKEVKSLDIKGNNTEIELTTEVKAGPASSDVRVEAVLENKNGDISVKSYNIKANFLVKPLAKGIIVPKLNQVSELLRSYIENEERKKVEKIEIVNGELVVTFTAPKQKIKPATEPKPIDKNTNESVPEPENENGSETKPEIGEFLNVTNFPELYTLLNKTDSGRSIAYEIMTLINDARNLSAHDKFVRYVKFMATLHDPALKHVLNKLLITNDPALSQVQKEEDGRREREEKANFSIDEAVAQHIRNLQGMKADKREDYINKTLTDAFQAKDEYPGFLEALDAEYTKFLEAEKTQTEPVKSVVERESDKIIEKLRKAIKKNNAIIAQATKELEEIEERIAEKKAQTTEFKGDKNKIRSII